MQGFTEDGCATCALGKGIEEHMPKEGISHIEKAMQPERNGDK